MLKQASVSQIRKQTLSRKDGHIVIAMCFYPRGLAKTLRDEYLAILAPDRALFKEWQKYANTYGHDDAFCYSNYEERFQLKETALDHLKRLSDLAFRQDVYLVCQCSVGERCHREMLLLLAESKFRAQRDQVFHEYPAFLSRFSINDRVQPILTDYFSNLLTRVEKSETIQNNGTDKGGFFLPTRAILLQKISMLRDLHDKPRAKAMLKEAWQFVVSHLPPEWLVLNPVQKSQLKKILNN